MTDTYPLEHEHESRLANVDEFLTLAGDFARDLGGEGELPQVEGVEQPSTDTDVLGKFLTNVALATDAQTNDKSGEEGENRPVVTISTIHAAKGLEWPVVFVPAVYTGSLPHSRSEDSAEERRLLYVAMTRAQALLYLSVPWHTNSWERERVSRSLFLPDDIMKYFSTFGPSFDDKVVEAMAKILGRKAPSMADTFKKLPEMFAIEDDRQPEFPAGYDRPAGHVSRQIPGGGYAQKRQSWSDPFNPTNPPRNGSAWDTKGYTSAWQKDYTTTMEKSSQFTMAAALPGFTTAGAHHTALASAGAGSGPKGAGRGQQPQGRHQAASTKRPANQPTLSSFCRANNTATTYPSTVNRPVTLKRPPDDTWDDDDFLRGVPRKRIVHPGQVENSFNQPLSQNTIRELTKRGLQDVKRRVQARRSLAETSLPPTITIKDDDDDDPDVEIVEVRKTTEQKKTVATKYPGFSSSPPRPEPSERPPVRAALEAAKDTFQSRVMTRHGVRRPVSFHATTMGNTTTAAKFGSTGAGGLAPLAPSNNNKYGVGVVSALGRQEGLKPMEKLTKPFKPLTVDRNGNLARGQGKNARRF